MQSPAGFSEEKRVRALPLLQALESQRCAVLLTVVLSRIKVAKFTQNTKCIELQSNVLLREHLKI